MKETSIARPCAAWLCLKFLSLKSQATGMWKQETVKAPSPGKKCRLRGARVPARLASVL